MVRIENHCSGCTIHCINCGAKRVEVHYCDKCGSELTKICEGEDEELCEVCYDEQYREDDE